MPEGPHPFPSRTRKLSPPGPMILPPQGCGTVGRCRDLYRSPLIARSAGFLLSGSAGLKGTVPLLPGDCPRCLPARAGGPGSAQALRLDRTKPPICSAAQLVPSRAALERTFEQCSPSLTATASVRQVTVPEPPRFASPGAPAFRKWQ
jgi:hypothetical protein